jgi:L-ascorbate metabolism protein UlaG (beta-lactamase superfamily)
MIMKLKIALAALMLSTASLYAQDQQATLPVPERVNVKGGELTIQPITHASLVLSYQNKNIYVDPTGGAEAFTGLGTPHVILITDIHGDHFDKNTIAAINKTDAVLVVPQAVADSLPATINKKKLVILRNGAKTTQAGVTILAVPMYNLPDAENAKFHPKGRGNGYILEIGGKRVYISGDTADTPEMRALKNIDIAFVCMNLPYTMDVNGAASGVLAFKPKVVYPYHYRGQDVEVFKKLVNEGDKNIEVKLLQWYPGK